ncbi:MAG: polysaccharide deacetylase family protein [Verrucomicrobiae bacterium]|nr:polysaccharide deacetylase family protein [Verrucomicrobiae bacterium]
MNQGCFLLSVDLEDVRDGIPEGHRLADRVPAITHRLLDCFRQARVHVTFFVTGAVALRHRSLLAEIAQEGHELACHTYAHKPLDHYTVAEFENDLHRNIEVIAGVAREPVRGFRAPVLSMTEHTVWVYPVLARHGITYSSSVLPAKNPLYGWPGFGHCPCRIEGVLEIPVTVARFAYWTVPFASGVYFRVLPYWFVRYQFVAHSRLHRPVSSYLHPYDFDVDQQRVPHPGLGANRFYNFLIYYNRRGALARLQRILSLHVPTQRYGEFAASWGEST